MAVLIRQMQAATARDDALRSYPARHFPSLPSLTLFILKAC